MARDAKLGLSSGMMRVLILCFVILAVFGPISNAAQAQDGPGLRLHHFTLGSAAMRRPLSIYVHLPPGYWGSDRAYPVVYMHDGADAFRHGRRWDEQKRVTVPFERVAWELDQSLDRLVLSGRGGNVIVVAIDTETRVEHFSPWIWSPAHHAEGRAYMDFVVHTLKPEIDRRYRTDPDREATAMLGASFGGMITLYGIVKFPHVFSKAAILSPVLTRNVLGDELNAYIALRGPLEDVDIFLDIGGKESAKMKTALDRTYATLIERGFYVENVEMRVVPEGRHLWSSWKTRAPVALGWLFGWG